FALHSAVSAAETQKCCARSCRPCMVGSPSTSRRFLRSASLSTSFHVERVSTFVRSIAEVSRATPRPIANAHAERSSGSFAAAFAAAATYSSVRASPFFGSSSFALARPASTTAATTVRAASMRALRSTFSAFASAPVINATKSNTIGRLALVTGRTGRTMNVSISPRRSGRYEQCATLDREIVPHPPSRRRLVSRDLPQRRNHPPRPPAAAIRRRPRLLDRHLLPARVGRLLGAAPHTPGRGLASLRRLVADAAPDLARRRVFDPLAGARQGRVAAGGH